MILNVSTVVDWTFFFIEPYVNNVDILKFIFPDRLECPTILTYKNEVNNGMNHFINSVGIFWSVREISEIIQIENNRTRWQWRAITVEFSTDLW